MQKQTNPEPLGVPMAKVILVVAIIVSLGMVLGVVGYVLTKQKCAVQNPPVAQKADEAADVSSKALATEDWQTYRNEELGFEFRYPQIYEFEKPEQASDGSKIILGNLRAKNKDAEGTIGIISKPEKLDPANIMGLYGKIEDKDIKNITVDGIGSYAYREGDAGCGGSIVLIPDSNATIQLSFVDCRTKTQKIDFVSTESYMDQILSTFKFTESDEVNN